MYFDTSLASSGVFTGSISSNDEDIYIGRGAKNNRIGVAGAGFDNI